MALIQFIQFLEIRQNTLFSTMFCHVCHFRLSNISQSLEVSKIKKNKKNIEKFWSSIINIYNEMSIDNLKKNHCTCMYRKKMMQLSGWLPEHCIIRLKSMQLKNVHHSQLCNKQKYYILHQL